MFSTNKKPDGWGLKSADWHFERFVEFSRLKHDVGEPSPHLAVVGNICEKEKLSLNERLWLIGNYACSYCLPTAQVITTIWNYDRAVNNFDQFEKWLKDNWPGIVTRTERRAVRTHPKYVRCLKEWLRWITEEFPKLQQLQEPDDKAYYDQVFNSVTSVYSFGRYISIRIIEGLRRYCGLEHAKLYDIRSIGGWSPKKCLTLLYPEHADVILIDDKPGNLLTNQLAEDLLDRVKQELPWIDHYVIAAMLCEYKGAYEKKHQYVGWTIDQEPLLYDKVLKHFGNQVSGISEKLWGARKELFPQDVLGEVRGWGGTRWDVAKILRDYGYVWSDLKYDYWETLKKQCWAQPVPKGGAFSLQKGNNNMSPAIQTGIRGFFRKGGESAEERQKPTIPTPVKENPIITEQASVKSPTVPETGNTRKGINVILPGRLYQRGQILTWKLKEKERFLESHGIGLVVNFWPKIDYDMGELPPIYWYAPVPHADDMVSSRIVRLADCAADLMAKENIGMLSLCEAGKTRSIFFAILVMSNLLGCTLKEAYGRFRAMNIGSKLRPNMIRYLEK